MLKKCLLSGRTIRPDEKIVSIPCASKGAQAKTGFVLANEIGNGYTMPIEKPCKAVEYTVKVRFTRKGCESYKDFIFHGKDEVTAFLEVISKGKVTGHGAAGEWLVFSPITTFAGLRYIFTAIAAVVDIQYINVSIAAVDIDYSNVNVALKNSDTSNVFGGKVNIKAGELKSFQPADIDMTMRGLDCLSRIVKASEKSVKSLVTIIEKSARMEYPVDSRAEKMTVKGSKA